MERDHFPDPGIDDLLERRQRQLLARLRLDLMKRFEGLVSKLEQLPERTDLTAERSEFWQRTWRVQYEQAIGVAMEQRDLLQSRLQQVAEDGSETVEDIIADVRRNHRKRFSGGSGGS